MNNFDKIKSMSVDETVAFIRGICCASTCNFYTECRNNKNCDAGTKEWLLSESTPSDDLISEDEIPF